MKIKKKTICISYYYLIICVAFKNALCALSITKEVLSKRVLQEECND